MNNNVRKYIALIPAYNPDEKMVELVKRLLENDFEIVVVDDGSKDECQKHFKAIEKISHVIHHEVNKGKGRALKTGLTYIKEHYDWYVVITLDCDGQHTIKDALRLCDYCDKHPIYLSLGVRTFDSKDVPLRSRVGNNITRFVYYLSTRTKVTDTQTGLRAFTNDLIDQMLEIKGERFEYEINVLLYLARNKIQIREVPIKTIYIDNNSGSHFNPIKDSFKIYKEIFKFSFSSICSFLIDMFLFFIFSRFINTQISNIISRVFSSSFDFTMNRKHTFKNRTSLKSSITSYFVLALVILIVDTLILTCFINLGLGRMISKFITEVIIFLLSYIIPMVRRKLKRRK